MRRPLWALTMCLVGLIALWQWLAPPPDTGPLTTKEGRVLVEGEELLVEGRVTRIERNTSYQGEEILLYLDQSIQTNFKDSVYKKIHRIRLSIQGRKSSKYMEEVGVICHISPERIPRMGSLVLVRGRLSYYREATNPGEWDARAYYSRQSIGAGLKDGILVKESTSYSYVRNGLYRLREHWRKRLYKVYPEREAGIMSAMLLGDKKDVERETMELYRKGGIIHILSISGLHISILGMGLYRLLKDLGLARIPSGLVSGVFLILYGMMVGFPLSAIRAIGMFLVYMLGECLYRTYDTMTALGCMAVLMLAAHPENVQNSGFLFSFGSLGGIVLFVPFFQSLWEKEDGWKKARWKKKKRKTDWWRQKGWGDKSVGQVLAESVGAGMGISIFTLPIHLWFYYEAPFYSIWLNLLVLPLMGLVMGSGLLVMLIPGVGWLGRINIGILGACDRLCLMIEKLPLAMWRPGRPQVWQVAAFYGFLLLAVWMGERERDKTQVDSQQKPQEKPREKKGKGAFNARRWRGIACVTTALVILGIRPGIGMNMTFLHVGQGDGICIEKGRGSAYLVDCGSTGKKSVGKKILIPYLKYRGIHTLKAVVLTHPDQDHVNGILELLENREKEGITIERIILPEVGGDCQALAKLQDRIGCLAPQVPILYMKQGDVVEDGGIRLECLHPRGKHPEKGSQNASETGYDTTNAYSLCFLLSYGDFTALLTGDVEGEGEEELVEELRRAEVDHISVLKVAHHGSRHSTGQALLEEIEPCLAVLSYGEGNSYGHPHKETLERLEECGTAILHTPVEGAIGVWTDGKKMKVKGYLNAQIKP